MDLARARRFESADKGEREIATPHPRNASWRHRGPRPEGSPLSERPSGRTKPAGPFREEAERLSLDSA